MAATETQRRKSQSNVLRHDFSTTVLKPWGRQRNIVCEGVDGNIEGGNREIRSIQQATTSETGDRRHIPRIGAPEIGFKDDDGCLEQLRKKLLGHLRDAADRMKLDVPPNIPTSAAASAAPEPVPSSSAVHTAIPWTLRTRRGPLAMTAERNSLMRSEVEEKNKPLKFSVSLTIEEIEEDVYALTGSRPRRRPKKRARIVQRQLDETFPGLLLSEITPELYRIPE